MQQPTLPEEAWVLLCRAIGLLGLMQDSELDELQEFMMAEATKLRQDDTDKGTLVLIASLLPNYKETI